MSSVFSSDFKEQVRSRTDLVELIAESVSLRPRRGGSEYVGLCPFHDDHNPSMCVYPERQSWRCWVCSEGGDCFTYVMKIESVEFRDALEMLARRANLELPKNHRSQSPQEAQNKNRLYEVLTWAEQQFHDCFLNAPEARLAREYVQQRGFRRETIDKFRIGYHPADQWQWLLSRAREKFDPAELLAVRLVAERSENRGYYDNRFLFDRVLFPIHDTQARTVAFGGRILPGHSEPDAAKYWNSPESTLFAKSRLLYGLDAAKDTIRRSKMAVVVEGYTDCMMVHQYGVENAVGTLGTALTETHVIALKRFAQKVVLVYDGDEAGQNAAERSLIKFLAHEIDLRILTLPDGMDPADFLIEKGVDAFRGLIEQAAEAWEHKLRLSITRHGLETIHARERVLDEMFELLAQAPRISGTIREDIILGKLAQRASVPEQKVRQRLRDFRNKNVARRPSVARRNDSEHETQRSCFYNDKNVEPNKDDRIECDVLEIVFAAPETVHDFQVEIEPDEFKNEHLRQLLKLCYELAERGLAPSYDCVTSELEDLDLKQLAAWIDGDLHEKGIAQKLKEDWQTKPGDDFLRQAIQNVKWRQEEQSHELSKGQMAQLAGASAGLDEEAKARLRQSTEFNKKRAT